MLPHFPGAGRAPVPRRAHPSHPTLWPALALLLAAVLADRAIATTRVSDAPEIIVKEALHTAFLPEESLYPALKSTINGLPRQLRARVTDDLNNQAGGNPSKLVQIIQESKKSYVADTELLAAVLAASPVSPQQATAFPPGLGDGCQWDPAGTEHAPDDFLRTFGNGAFAASRAINPNDARPCHIVGEKTGMPLRRLRFRAYRNGTEHANFETDELGFADLSSFLKDAHDSPPPAIEIESANPAVCLYNGKGLFAGNGPGVNTARPEDQNQPESTRSILRKFHQRIVFGRNDLKIFVRRHEDAWAYGDRLYAAYQALRTFIGDQIDDLRPVWVTLGHLVAMASTGFPWGEVVIQPHPILGPFVGQGKYLTSDEVFREEMGHVLHFRRINRARSVLYYYMQWFGGTLRNWVVGGRLPDPLWVDFKHRPTAAAVVERPAAAPGGGLEYSNTLTHNWNMLTPPVIAYAESWGLLCHYGGYPAKTYSWPKTNWLEGLRIRLRNQEGIDPATTDLPDTTMPADRVISSEGHLCVLLFLDFPRAAQISIADVFREMGRSHAITFCQLARHYRDAVPAFYPALRAAALRQNLYLDELLSQMSP